MAFFVFFKIIFMSRLPKQVIAMPFFSPGGFLAQTFKIIRIIYAPIPFVLNLPFSLAFWLGTNLLVRTVFIRDELILADSTTHSQNIAHKISSVNRIFCFKAVSFTV